MRFASLLLAASVSLPGAAIAQPQVNGRVMVLLGTSASMGYHFAAPKTIANPPSGDFPGGDGSFSYTDTRVSAQFMFPGKLLATGTRDGVDSRLYAAKAALGDALSAYSGVIDFGLMTWDFQLCAFGSPLCFDCALTCGNNPCGFNGCCGGTCLYANTAFSQLANINWEPQGCAGPGGGGRVVVVPGAGSSAKIVPWLDGVEVHKDSGDKFTGFGTTGTPTNPELRAAGSTPLAESIAVARTAWYDAAKASDAQINCRPYALVIETDGGESYGCTLGVDGKNPPGPGNPCCTGAQCAGGVCGADPVAAVQALTGDNPTNPVKTYVLGLAITQPADQMTLNAMAAAGGTGQARFANSQSDLDAAYATILAASVKTEVCNGADDNCNGLVDEGLGVYQSCATNAACASGTCNAGRCACSTSAQCASGHLCSSGFCIPQCTVGVGACLRAGVSKCDPANDTQSACCANDGLATCTPLVAGTPTPEICNGLDDDCDGVIDNGNVCATCTPTVETCNGKDDDCDGIVDDHLIDAGRGCGLDVGICKPGTTVCVNSSGVDVTMSGVVADAGDRLICQGALAPQVPQCNGCDNDCDGLIDAPAQPCYDGPAGTEGVGVCRGGSQQCTAMVCGAGASWTACAGESLPQKEICDGLDDDCNGVVDDVPGAGGSCCPSNLCGIGICAAGTLECSGGALACVGGQGPEPEVCNGLDDDCNGKVDDLPNVGGPCLSQGGCAGTLQCDAAKMQLVCVAGGGKPEICNGVDDDCDGVVDDPADIAKNDPRVGKPCGNDQNLPPPCMAGITVCQNGSVVCAGAVAPKPEVCNCVDDDCNGKIDDGATCGSGTSCYQCQCLPTCAPNEFPCPGGYQCDANDYCVPVKACSPPCAAGFVCRAGACVDRCTEITCPATYVCQGGACVGMSCVELKNCKGCVNGAGQRCNPVTRACEPDPCCGVSCPGAQYCDAATGRCAGTCANVMCPMGQLCTDGVCATPKCDAVTCADLQICDPATGACVTNPCASMSCMRGLVCVAGQCVPDTCPMVQCPDGYACSTSPVDGTHACNPIAAPPGKDNVVGAGGSGACSVGFARAPAGDGGPLPLLAIALLLVGARLADRARARRLRAHHQLLRLAPVARRSLREPVRRRRPAPREHAPLPARPLDPRR